MAPPVAAPPPRPSYANVQDPETTAQAGVHPAAPPPEDGVEKVAVIVTHGMGQQIPFETLELLAEAVRTEAANRNPAAPPPPVATRVARLGTAGNPGEPQLPRAELRLFLPDGTPRDVHFYEVYWAPLTEGKVTLRDVIAFLFDAGWMGIKNSFQGDFFERWMFGAFQRFTKRTWTLFFCFLLCFLEIGSLVLINGIIGAVAISKALTGGATIWHSPQLRAVLTTDMFCVVAALGCVAIGVFLVPQGLRLVAWTFVWIGLLALPVAALLMGVHIGFPATRPELQLSIMNNKWVLLILWGLALVASYVAKWVLVEYVGDVAAYVNAHQVSKFWDLRKSIYETATRVFGPVYKARRDEEVIYEWDRFFVNGQPRPFDATPVFRFRYEKIYVVGHSLGTVISYDALNGLLLDEELSAPALYVPQRTMLLLTFGSPLDKTAFIFRTHKKLDSEIREAAAAAVQPMIVSYLHRPRRWLNIFSRNDWVSGSLEFYDTNPPPPAPASPLPPALHIPVPVENVEDLSANTPLVAHVQYWGNPLLRSELYAALIGP
jgi:hypothetical protein